MASGAGPIIAGALQIPARVSRLDEEEFDLMLGHADVEVGENSMAEPWRGPALGLQGDPRVNRGDLADL